jgi:hypothetical protein
MIGVNNSASKRAVVTTNARMSGDKSVLWIFMRALLMFNI